MNINQIINKNSKEDNSFSSGSEKDSDENIDEYYNIDKDYSINNKWNHNFYSE